MIQAGEKQTLRTKGPSGSRREKPAPSSPVGEAPPRDPTLAHILKLSVPISVIVAERLFSIETILRFNVGTIVEFDVPFGSELSLTAGNRMIARGQAVKIGEHFGLRVTSVDSVRERIDALGHSDQP